MYTKKMLVTPEMAKKYLEKNFNKNRNVRQSVVDAYARDMAEGNWALTHQGIAFDEEGNLIDGQHRMLAVIKAGIPVEMLVTVGVPMASMGIMDIGIRRTSRDVLSMRYEEPYMLSTACISTAKFLMGEFRFTKNTITHSEIEQYMVEHLDAIQWIYACFCQGGGGKRANTRSAFFLSAVLAARLNGVPDRVIKDFLNVIVSNIVPETSYNVRAVLCYRDELEKRTSQNGLPRWTMKEANIETKKALWLFYNNKKRLPKGFTNPFPITDHMIRSFKFDGVMAL